MKKCEIFYNKKMSNSIAQKIVSNVFEKFDKDKAQGLSKFEFSKSINYLSHKLGGRTCCR